MKAYRVRHKPTGLFYQPGYRNLSEKGKIYLKRPSFFKYSVTLRMNKDTKIYQKYKDILDPINESRMSDYYFERTCKPNEFELVEFEIEIK